MNLRFALPGETDEIFRMYEAFNGKELEGIGLKYNPTRLMETVDAAVQSGSVVVGQTAEGEIFAAAAGIITPCAFTDDVFFNTTLFYVKPDYRHKTVGFMKNLLDFLRNTKVTKAIVSNPACADPGMNRFYRMNGFKLLEHHYIKDVQ